MPVRAERRTSASVKVFQQSRFTLGARHSTGACPTTPTRRCAFTQAGAAACSSRAKASPSACWIGLCRRSGSSRWSSLSSASGRAVPAARRPGACSFFSRGGDHEAAAPNGGGKVDRCGRTGQSAGRSLVAARSLDRRRRHHAGPQAESARRGPRRIRATRKGIGV